MTRDNRIDLGDGHHLEWIDDNHARLTHRRPDTGQPCGEPDNIISLDPADQWHWTAEQRDPLTLRENVNCSECGDRGRIVDDRWTAPREQQT